MEGLFPGFFFTVAAVLFMSNTSSHGLMFLFDNWTVNKDSCILYLVHKGWSQWWAKDNMTYLMDVSLRSDSMDYLLGRIKGFVFT